MTHSARAINWGAVVPTLGTRSSVVASVRSLLDDECLLSEVVVACQGNHAEVAGWLSFIDDGRLTLLESPIGASRGRNSGITHLLDRGVEAVALLDDDCTYESGSLGRATDLLRGGALAISGRLASLDTEQQRTRFPQDQAAIDKVNVWRCAMESGLVLSADFIRKYGLFDGALGVGAGSPWASGEGTELLLRGIADGASIVFDPAISISETGSSSSIYGVDRAAKARAYARGTGRVYAMHYSVFDQLRLLSRSLAKVVIGGVTRPRSLEINWQVFVGRTEGIFGRCLK